MPSAVCLIDTSVFCEILAIPGKSARHEEILQELAQRVERKESLLLPLATVLETGNHIGQLRDGKARRSAAQRFVEQVLMALRGEIPFTPTALYELDQLQDLLQEFPDRVGEGMGFGDLTILHEYRRQEILHTGRRVLIWSLDRHLSSYDRKAKI